MALTIYNTIDEAIQQINLMSSVLGKPKYLRGQHHDWNITSSLHRIQRLGDEQLSKTEVEKTLEFINWLKEQRERSSLFDNIQSMIGDLPYYAIAQHYGYKTDFIDFTTDINIAKAFALIGKQPGENGFIFCLWDKDVDLIKTLYWGYAEKLTKTTQEILKSIDYNPFLQLELPEISRITNQKGIFLWDANSFATSLFNGLIDKHVPGFMESHIFRFKQSDISVDIDTVRLVYPFPNVTEQNIDNFVQKYNHDNFYSNISSPTFPRIDVDLSDYFSANTWDFYHMFEINPEEYYPVGEQRITVTTLGFDEIAKIMLSPNYCIRFVEKWKKELERDHFIVYISESKNINILYVEVINEVLSSLSPYKHLPEESIEKILFRALGLLNMLISLCFENEPDVIDAINDELAEYKYDLTDANSNLEKTFDLLRSSVPLNIAVKKAWFREFDFIRVENKTGNSTSCVIPKDVVDDCTEKYKAEHIRILQELYDQSKIPPTIISYENRELKRNMLKKEDISWELMFDVVRDPKVLFNQTEIIDIFIYYFIPWQIVTCSKTNRIYDPYKIDNIRRLDVDSFTTKYPIYYKNGGYYVVLDEDTILLEDIYFTA